MKTLTQTATWLASLSLVGVCLLSSCANAGNTSGSGKDTGHGSMATTQRPTRLMDGNMGGGVYGNTGAYVSP